MYGSTYKKLPRIGKFIKTESRREVTGGREEEWGVTA